MKKKLPRKKKTGNYGEYLASEYLKKKGYQVVARNEEVGKWGEIDIVCVKGDKLVFAEVKTQKGKDFKSPWEQINRRKLQAMVRAGWLWAQRHKNLPQSLRLDAVTVLLNTSGKLKEIRHFENIYP